MKVFVPARHHLHRPGKDFSDGLPPFDHLERPERIDWVIAGLRSAGISDFVEISETGTEAVFSLHDHDYVEFLFALTEKIRPGQEYLPSIFHGDLANAPLAFRGGAYCRDIGTPVGPHTLEAALNSAAAAFKAAEYTLATNQNSFALCRPPGHHAGKRRYGGYCFFNNAYLAANVINASGLQTAVLDIDYHIGDGSLEFASDAAPYLSLHADAGRNFPYLASISRTERPYVTQGIFSEGIGIRQYLRQLDDLLLKIEDINPDIAVLSLGFDTLGADYIQDEETSIKVDDFYAIGSAVAKIRSPLIIILEGGYDPQHLTPSVARFFTGYGEARRREDQSAQRSRSNADHVF